LVLLYLTSSLNYSLLNNEGVFTKKIAKCDEI